MDTVSRQQQLIVFHVDNFKFAVYLPVVERVISAVEITPLPEAPDILAGIINVRGQVIPVINVRRRLGMAERDLELNDQFLIVRSSTRILALIADRVESVLETAAENIEKANTVFPGIGLVEGVMRLEDGMILIFDLEKFLSPPKEKALAQAIERHEKRLAAKQPLRH